MGLMSFRTASSSLLRQGCFLGFRGGRERGIPREGSLVLLGVSFSAFGPLRVEGRGAFRVGDGSIFELLRDAEDCSAFFWLVRGSADAAKLATASSVEFGMCSPSPWVSLGWIST